jgi:hypothetical protein
MMNDYTVMIMQRQVAVEAALRTQEHLHREAIKQPKRPLIRFGWILRFSLRKPAGLRRIYVPKPVENQACTTA